MLQEDEDLEFNNEVETKLNVIDSSRVTSNMVLLLLGRLVSLFGSQIYNFAIGLYVLQKTGSSAAFSMTLVFGMLPRILFGPLAGVISDRVDRKKIVVLSDILSGAIVLALAALATADELRVSYIYAANFLLNTCNTFFDIPMNASIPNIVDDKNLNRANSLNQTVSAMAQIGGPFLGGIVFALVDMRLFLIINATSFILSGISEMFIDFNLNNTDKQEEKESKEKKLSVGIIKEFKEVFKFLKTRELLIIIFGFSLFLNFFVAFGVTVPFPYIINNVIKLIPEKYGILEAMFPLGMMIGSIIMSIFKEKDKKYKSFIGSILLVSMATALMSLPVMPMFMNLNKNIYFVYYMISLIISGAAVIYANIPIQLVIQRETPDSMRGRIFALLETTSISIFPLGLILSGLLLERIPVYILPLLSGAVMIFITLAMGLNKEIRKI